MVRLFSDNHENQIKIITKKWEKKIKTKVTFASLESK